MLPFIILAMVNYYVMEFRGEPFQLLDIVGMGTAAEVVGEYSFKIKLMLGIPLIYALVFGEFVLKFQKLELGKKEQKEYSCPVWCTGCDRDYIMFYYKTYPPEA